MTGLKLGFVLLTMEDPKTGDAASWNALSQRALLAEEAGFDTVWVADELVWETPAWDGPRGWWECVAVTGAIAATTSTIGVGTWVLSALHRNPGLTAKIAETLDEISGGRFIFGLGSGHAARQAAAFGYPGDYTVSRYVEALSLITTLRGQGRASQDGEYHTAVDQVLTPRSPRIGGIPLMLGGHGPRTMRIAVENADIWSAFPTVSSQPEAFVGMLARLDAICKEAGRDPSSLGRSVGVAITPPGEKSIALFADEHPITGSTDDIVGALREFSEMGCTRIEVMAAGRPENVIAGLAPVLDEIRAA